MRIHTGPWRVRLLVARDGAPTIECTPYAADGSRVARDVRVGRRSIHAIRFSPTRPRIGVVYDTARRARPDVDDVILWNERGEITEATIANVVAEIDGVRYTPPLSCGLLGGTFRGELLGSGQIRERVLTRADVTRCIAAVADQQRPGVDRRRPRISLVGYDRLRRA